VVATRKEEERRTRICRIKGIFDTMAENEVVARYLESNGINWMKRKSQ
jgi:hypothetical protein